MAQISRHSLLVNHESVYGFRKSTLRSEAESERSQQGRFAYRENFSFDNGKKPKAGRTGSLERDN